MVSPFLMRGKYRPHRWTTIGDHQSQQYFKQQSTAEPGGFHTSSLV